MDLSRLQACPIKWRSITLSSVMIPPHTIARQVLWELFEINFRYELVTLDRLCYKLDDTPDARQILVLNRIPHFEGNLVPTSSSSGKSGFASEDTEDRRIALEGFFGVMEGWDGGPHAMSRHLSGAGRRLREHQLEGNELDKIEKDLVLHYVSVFSDLFGRAPLLPHKL